LLLLVRKRRFRRFGGLIVRREINVSLGAIPQAFAQNLFFLDLSFIKSTLKQANASLLYAFSIPCGEKRGWSVWV